MAIVINMPRSVGYQRPRGLWRNGTRALATQVSEGDLLAEIGTDKATMEFEAFPGQEGKLLYIGTGEGETVSGGYGIGNSRRRG